VPACKVGNAVAGGRRQWQREQENVRRTLTVGLLTVVLGSILASSASARGWTLYLKPGRVRPGGTVRIWTTARARTCALTIRIAGQNYRYRLDGSGDRFTFVRRTPLGKARVTVHCTGLVASATFAVVRRTAQHPAPRPSPGATRVTVYNVCHLNPGLGTYRSIDPVVNGQVEPTAAWLDSTGQLAFLAASTDGNNTVDDAIIPTAANRNVVAYFARCTWSNWVSVAQWRQAQAGMTAQAGSEAYLEEVMPINDSLDSLALPWVTPQLGWSECPPTPYADCDYELAPDS
jgi:hypothetical protein